MLRPFQTRVRSSGPRRRLHWFAGRTDRADDIVDGVPDWAMDRSSLVRFVARNR